jgi:hypothetical protein
MRKIYLFFIICIIGSSGYSQTVYFMTGKNFCTYDLKNEGVSVNPFTKKGEGSSYEIGFSLPIMLTRLPFDNYLNYYVGLTLNQYNAIGGNVSNLYEWRTEYVGLQNSIVFSFIKSNHLDMSIRGGINFGTMLYGDQIINNSKYDLKDQKEFTGIVFTPSLGLQAKCNLSEYGYLSFGYNYSGSFNLSNSTAKKLTFKNHQIVFGVSFELF